MKWRFFVLMMGLLLPACEGEEINPPGARTAIRLTAEIEGVRTRLSASSWEKGDAIGVYMKKAGSPLDAGALASNMQYLYNESNLFHPKDQQNAIYFPYNNQLVDFIGYYPYKGEMTDFQFPLNLTIQGDQGALDLMYADNVVNRDSTNRNVDMSFAHQLSKLWMEINHYRGLELENLSLIITDVPTTGSFDLTTGTLSVDMAKTNVACCVNKDCTVAEAILMPGTNLAGSDMWFIADEGAQVYKVSLAELVPSDILAKSTQYNFRVTLHSDEVEIVDNKITIKPWYTTTPDSIEMIAERTPEDPPAIRGSFENPYTVAEAIINQGYSGVWVKGYIVGGFTGTSVGSFTTDTSTARNSCIAIADTQYETEIANIMAVELPSGSIRDDLNLADNPGNMHKRVMIKGDLTTYYSAPGIKNPKQHQFLTE